MLARSPKAAATVVQGGALPALAMVAGEGLSERAQVNATKVRHVTLVKCLTVKYKRLSWQCSLRVSLSTHPARQSQTSHKLSLVSYADLQAIQRLAAMPSVQAMVRSSPAGRFLDQQVCLTPLPALTMHNVEPTPKVLPTSFGQLAKDVSRCTVQTAYMLASF